MIEGILCGAAVVAALGYTIAFVGKVFGFSTLDQIKPRKRK